MGLGTDRCGVIVVVVVNKNNTFAKFIPLEVSELIAYYLFNIVVSSILAVQNFILSEVNCQRTTYKTLIKYH